MRLSAYAGLIWALLLAVPAAASRTAAPAADPALRELLAEGRRSLRERRFSTATAIFGDAVRLDPRSSEAYLDLGNAYYQRGLAQGRAGLDDLRRALGAYGGALRADPSLKSLRDPFLLHLGMAQCLEALGRPVEAAQRMRQAAEAAPHNPIPMLESAALHYRLGQGREAAKDLLATVQRAWRIGAFRSVVRLLNEDRRYAGLLDVPLHRTILELYDRVDAGVLAEWAAREQIEERLSFRDALAPMPSRRRSSREERAARRVRGLVEDADQAFAWGRLEPAIDGYRRALAEDKTRGALTGSERAQAFERLGVAYRRLGRNPEAIEALDESTRLQPNDAAAYYQLALALSAGGRFSGAVRALDLALQNAPDRRELKKALLLARTDSDLEPLRELPEFQRVLRTNSARLK